MPAGSPGKPYPSVVRCSQYSRPRVPGEEGRVFVAPHLVSVDARAARGRPGSNLLRRCAPSIRTSPGGIGRGSLSRSQGMTGDPRVGFEASGFHMERVIDTPTGISIIETATM